MDDEIIMKGVGNGEKVVDVEILLFITSIVVLNKVRLS